MTCFGIDNYLVFVVSGILLNIAPGPDTIYILSRSISQGRNAGIASVLGICTGGLVHNACAAFGLSIVLAKSAELYGIVKIIGAVYLCYLGIEMFMNRNKRVKNTESIKNKGSFWKIYSQGFLTNVFNPKVALFFISFLPQFIDSSRAHGPIPFLILGFTFFTTGTIWCLFLVFFASMITRGLRKNAAISHIMQKCCGGIFIGLGLKLAFDKK
jgi:threonine/homoserine/homoserine lactone efflux protein